MSKPRATCQKRWETILRLQPVIVQQILGSWPARPVFGSKRNWRRWKQPRPLQRPGHLNGHPERTQYCTWTTWDMCWNRNTRPVQGEFSTFIFVDLGIKVLPVLFLFLFCFVLFCLVVLVVVVLVVLVVVVVVVVVVSFCGITMFVSGFRQVGVTCLISSVSADHSACTCQSAKTTLEERLSEKNEAPPQLHDLTRLLDRALIKAYQSAVYHFSNFNTSCWGMKFSQWKRWQLPGDWWPSKRTSQIGGAAAPRTTNVSPADAGKEVQGTVVVCSGHFP